MKHKEIEDNLIKDHLSRVGFDQSADEGRLMLLELICKAAAGYRSSHTEEIFLKGFGLLTARRKPNAKGLRFIMNMVYLGSNKRPECFALMEKYRK